jgi:hypothetical protein
MKWKRLWIEDQKVPFIFQGNTLIGYDDLESIDFKVSIHLSYIQIKQFLVLFYQTS